MKGELRRGLRAVAVVGAIAVALPPQGHAQSAEQPKACSASAYRQFDFWLGEWEVRNPNDEVVGSNTIQRILNGCVLHESWIGASGGGGQSHNIYNMQTEQWHQTWVDDSGRLLQLDGALDDEGRMVLRGTTLAAAGGSVLNEISWEPLERGRVRQVWRISRDGGSSWQVIFNGLYVRK